MMPGVQVHPHCGPTNHRLRLHLPIILPYSALTTSGLSVDGRQLTWERDKCLIFDDSFEHEVHLSTHEEAQDEDASLARSVRVVLIVDMWQPDAEAAGLRPRKRMRTCDSSGHATRED